MAIEIDGGGVLPVVIAVSGPAGVSVTGPPGRDSTVPGPEGGRGLVGPPGPGAITTAVAMTAIPADTNVVDVGNGRCAIADPSNAAHSGKLLGLVRDAVQQGDLAQIAATGTFTGVAGSFAANAPLYIRADGGITSQRPSSGWTQILGRATNGSDINYRPGLAGLLPAGQSLILGSGGTAPQATAATLAQGSDPRAWPSVAGIGLTGVLVPKGTRDPSDDLPDALGAALPAPGIIRYLFRKGPMSPFLALGWNREWGIRNGTDKGDCWAGLNALLADGESIDLDTGIFNISDGLTLPRVGQVLTSSSRFTQETFSGGTAGRFGTGTHVGGRYGAGLQVQSGRAGYPDFNMTAPAVVTLTHECEYSRVCQMFWHPTQTLLGRAPTFADLKQYPWAIDISKAVRAKVDQFQLQRAFNGLRGVTTLQDALRGGAWTITRAEIGAFNIPFALNSPQTDFLEMDLIRLWVFGMSGNEFEPIYYARPPIALFGDQDGGRVGSLTSWKTRIQYNNANGLGIDFGDIYLDGGNATFEHIAGNSSIATLRSLSDAPVSSVTCAGGECLVGTLALEGIGNKGPDAPLLSVTGGHFASAVSGFSSRTGFTEPNTSSTVHASVSGGYMDLGNVHCRYVQNVARSQPMIRQTGGRIGLANAHAEDIGTGSGTFVSIATDERHNILGVQGNGWTNVLPASQALGNYIGIK